MKTFGGALKYFAALETLGNLVLYLKLEVYSDARGMRKCFYICITIPYYRLPPEY
jgi:hypothetical protein